MSDLLLKLFVALSWSNSDIVKILKSRVIFELTDADNRPLCWLTVAGDNFDLFRGKGIKKETFLIGGDKFVEMLRVRKFVRRLL